MHKLKLEMADVVEAHMEIQGFPILTSNQCHTLAMKLNEKLDYDALTAQLDEGLAREAELQKQLVNSQKVGPPHFCGEPMTKNPHPEAGIPGRYLEVGAVYECIPCLVASRHSWAKKADALQQRLAGAEKPQPLFVATVLRKLRRFEECASDGQDTDIGSHWFEVLTRLGLLNRIRRSPALWELTDEAEQFLARPGCADGEKAS